MRFLTHALIASLAVSAAAPAFTARPAKSSGPPPVAIQSLLACRAIADSAARLSCFDAAAQTIGQAIDTKELVVIDKAKANEAKRELFGFSTPNFAGLLGGGDLNQIESTVTSSGRNRDGGHIVRLADGSSWSQNDDTPIALPPEKGDKVLIKRGTLGSYIMRVGNQPGVKVHRTN